MQTEVWLPIQEVDCKYLISNLGNIKNVKSGKTLKPNKDTWGYYVVTGYTKNSTKKALRIHKYVALYFCEGYREGLVVNHKDGNKLNNIATNLEWCTHSENTKHAYKLGLAKLTSSTFPKRKVLCMETGIEYDSISDASRSTGVSRGNINSVCIGTRKTAGGYTWRYIKED